jgi:hypothetical protein
VLDLETTSLRSDAGEPWEFGLIEREIIPALAQTTIPKRQDAEYLWRTMPDLTRADPESLRVGRFYERTKNMRAAYQKGMAYNLVDWGLADDDLPWSDPAALALDLARLIDGAIVVGCNPGFDRDFLRPFLHRHGQAYTAHYRPMCVTTMGAGFLYGQRRGDEWAAVPEMRWPLSSSEVSLALGVDPAGFDRHSALGDCRWALAQLDVITGETS